MLTGQDYSTVDACSIPLAFVTASQAFLNFSWIDNRWTKTIKVLNDALIEEAHTALTFYYANKISSTMLSLLKYVEIFLMDTWLYKDEFDGL